MSETPEKQPIDKRLENLCPPWGPGNPPPKSPGGSGPHLTTILKKIMACKSPAEAEAEIRAEYPDLAEEKITRAHVYMAKIDRAATDGEEWALKMAFDRTEGKAQERVEMSGMLRNEIEIDPSKLTPEELAVLRKIADQG
jgi:hypothetical protein